MTRAKGFRLNLRRFAGLLSLALLAELAVMAIFFAQADVVDAQNAYITSNSAQISPQSGYGSAFRNFPYSKSLTATGPVGSVTWSISSGTLPAGLSLGSSTNLMNSITGTPTGSGASTFTVQAAGATSGTVTSTFTVTVFTSTGVAITPSSPSMSVSTILQLTATSTETDPNATQLNVSSLGSAWSCSGAGYSSITTAGLLSSGASAGPINCSKTFDSQTSPTDTVTVTTNAPQITTPATLPTPCDVDFTCPQTQFTGTGGTAPYTFQIVSGAPTGCPVSVSTAGVYLCTPTAAGNFNTFVVRITDSLLATSTKTFTQVVNGTITSRVAAANQTTITQGGSSQLSATVNYGDGGSYVVTNGSSGLSVGTGGGNSLAGVSSVPVTISITAGTPFKVYARQGANSTDTISYSDSSAGGNTYTIPIVNNSLYGNHFMSEACTLNPSGVTSVTATKSNPGTTANMDLLVVPLLGGSCTPDGSAVFNGVNAGSNTSLGTANLTTTNTIAEYVDVATDVGQGQGGFTCTAPFALAVFTSHMSVCYQIVNVPQANLSTSVSWNPTAVVAAGNILAATQAASSAAGAQWHTNCGSVSSTGLFTSNSVCSPAAVFFNFLGSPSNTVNITVNPPSFTSLTIAPLTTAPSQGGSVTFSCAGNPGPVDVTSSATFALAPQSGDTSGLLALTGNIAAVSASLTGTMHVTCSQGSLTSPPATVTVAAASNASLLGGCTFVGSGGCSTPVGWTFVMQQDFECGPNSHASPANPSCGTLPGNQTNIVGSGAFQTAQNHTPGGQYSFGGTYTGDASQLSWLFNQNGGGLGTISSVYISFWNYHSSGGYYSNSDYQLANLKPGASYGFGPGTACNVGENSQGTFNLQVASLTSVEFALATQGAAGNGPCAGGFIVNPTNGFAVGPLIPFNGGSWHQYELWITPNTTAAGGTYNGYINVDCGNAGFSSSHAACGNGRIAIWQDGTKVWDSTNVDLNNLVSGNPNYTNDPMVWVGGFITSFGAQNANGVFINGDPSNQNRCDTFGTGTGTPGPGLWCPGPQPGTGGPPVFNRYFDDIVVLKQ